MHRFALIALLLTSSAHQAAAEVLEVFAAASLTESFRELGERFAHAPRGCPPEFNFGGTNELRLQMENGAPADVFASASAEEMEKAVRSGLVTQPIETFAENKLVVLVPRDNPGKVSGPGDLAKPGLKLVLANAEVPVGRYTLRMLDKMQGDAAFGPGFRDRVLRNVRSFEPNVKQVAGKVALGEADAGVAYVSDVTPAIVREVTAFAVPRRFNIEARYVLAVAKNAPHRERAKRFVDYVLSEEGQNALQKHGFLPVVSHPQLRSAR